MADNTRNVLDNFEDVIREADPSKTHQDQYSRYCDFIYYPSSRNPELTLAMRVLKPEKPGYLLASTHGWHMSVPRFQNYETAQSPYLCVEVDMRGRAFSEGKPDCNGLELYDVYDAILFAKKKYASYLVSQDVLYFEAGSGGGGNAYAIAAKFPDLFAHVTALCGISDYHRWYREDQVGEFRDELDIWVGSPQNTEAYASRSGITGVGNLLAPLHIVHGNRDARVPVVQARDYVEAAQKAGKAALVTYDELDGIGGQAHWENMAPQDQDKMMAHCAQLRDQYREPVELPEKGNLTVCGYIVTKAFELFLESIDQVASVTYDLTAHTVSVDREGYRLIWKK